MWGRMASCAAVANRRCHPIRQDSIREPAERRLWQAKAPAPQLARIPAKAAAMIDCPTRYHLGLTPLRIVAQPFFEPTREELRFLPEGPRVLRNHPGGGALLGWVAIQHSADIHEGSINVLDLVSGRNRSFP